jgi:hypothetical protein
MGKLTVRAGPRGPLRDHLTSAAERHRPRRAIGLGSTRLHHREGQGHQAVIEGQTGLRRAVACGGMKELRL